MFYRYKKSLNECFALLKKIQGNPDGEIRIANTLQQLLLKRIVECERRVRKVKKEREKIKASFGNKYTQLTKEESKSAKKRIKVIDEYTETLHKIMWIYRDIGDGIAYTYISPLDIKPLAFKESAGFISGKKGTRLERQILRFGPRLAHSGVLLIMNDITNCLRYGDITIAFANEILQVIECKSGKSKKRAERDIRQKENIERMMKYLTTDSIDSLYGEDGNFSREQVHSPPLMYKDVINRLINQSEQEGTSFASPEVALLYIVTRTGNFSEMEQAISNWGREVVFSVVNELKFSNTGYYPFPLLFDDPYSFYNGEYVIGIALHFGTLENRLNEREIAILKEEEIRNLSDINTTSNYLHLKSKDGAYFSYSYHFVGRLFAEFLSLNWFINEITNGIDQMTFRLGEGEI